MGCCSRGQTAHRDGMTTLCAENASMGRCGPRCEVLEPRSLASRFYPAEASRPMTLQASECIEPFGPTTDKQPLPPPSHGGGRGGLDFKSLVPFVGAAALRFGSVYGRLPPAGDRSFIQGPDIGDPPKGGGGGHRSTAWQAAAQRWWPRGGWNRQLLEVGNGWKVGQGTCCSLTN